MDRIASFTKEVRCLGCDYSRWLAQLRIYDQTTCEVTLHRAPFSSTLHTQNLQWTLFNSLWKWALFYILCICLLSLKRQRISLIWKLVFHSALFLIHGLAQTIRILFDGVDWVQISEGKYTVYYFFLICFCTPTEVHGKIYQSTNYLLLKVFISQNL